MDNRDHIVLSILVVSHNQCHLLPRCMDSILAQRLDVPYEVIVSDDRSTDGTWELIQRYQQRYPAIVRGVKCNSDECNPSNRSERCGWNKANAYRHARGDFFVNIDADDYLRSDDIYQLQLNALLANPDCSMCQQRAWQVQDGAPIESGFAWPNHPNFRDGLRLVPLDLITNGLRGLNPTYMIRRNPLGEDPVELYGKLFDDTIITYYHLQFGNVVFIDRADYVWVQYDGSISNSSMGMDKEVLYGLLPLQHALLVPKFKNLFITEPNRYLVHALKATLFRKIRLQQSTVRYLSQLKGFIFDYFSGGQKGIANRVRIALALVTYKRISKEGKVTHREKARLYNLLLGK